MQIPLLIIGIFLILFLRTNFVKEKFQLMERNLRDVANACSDQEFEKAHKACKLQLTNANDSYRQAEDTLDK